MNSWLALLAAFLVTLAAIFPFRRLAMRFGILDHPGGHKSHANPIPYLGGLTVLAGLAIALAYFSPGLWRILVLLALVAGLGLVDDILSIKVSTKVISEVILAAFDTSLVIASRLASGRPVQLGGRDHFSHRLRLLGWSPRRILAAVVAASIASGLIAALALTYPLGEAWLAVPIAFAYLVAWLRLLRVDPYSVAGPQGLEVYRAGNE